MKLLLLVLIAMGICASCMAAITETGSIDELTDVNRLMFPRDGITYQVSSYDRTGGNDDGFTGKYSFIRKEGEDLVIFDQQGPGCIYRIWSANPERGRVRFYFDGETEPRIDAEHFQDLFTGNYYPFVKPIVTNFLGGWNSYMPIPFKKSCKIVAQGPVLFLQITWRKFASDQGVKTFTRELSAEEKARLDHAVAVWSKPGDPPVPFGPQAKTISRSFDTKDKVISFADIPGAGVVKALKIKLQSSDIRMLRKVVLRSFTDGNKKPDVWSPVGDFFMTGFGGIDTRGMLIGVKDGEMYCYFPMPFEKGVRLELSNETNSSLKGICEVVYEPMQSLPADTFRFYAWWHRQNPTVNGQPFPILEATGRGHWCGVSHYMNDDRGLGFLEGDEMLWVDGRDNSHYNGTGTEDYFNCGWYFGGEGCMPLYGCTQHDEPGSKIHAYRIHLTDLVPFNQQARIVIEHGPGNDINADYAGVSYWYADPSATHNFSTVRMSNRLLKPVSIPKSTEAEASIAAAQGSVRVIEDTDLNISLAGGKGVRLSTIASNARVSFTIKPQKSAYMNLYAWVMKGPSGGKANVYIDGSATGITVDSYAPKLTVEKILVAQNNNFRAGEHEVEFRVPWEARDKEFVVDCLKLEQAGIVEVESLKVLKSTDPLDLQYMDSFGNEWGNNAQLFFRPTRQGASFTLELPVERSGKYHVWAYMTRAGDYGISQLKIDGTPAGKPFDAHDGRVSRSSKLDLGVMELKAGNHELALEVTGKNSASAGYYAGIDSLALEPLK